MTPPPRHVLMTADAVGGVWVFATTLARRLCRAGDRVTLAVMGPTPSPAQWAEIADVEGLSVEITNLVLEWMDPDGADEPRALDRLARLAHRIGPDVVHLNGYREARAEWPAPVVVTAHSCVGSWWRACRATEPDEPRWRTYCDAVREGLAACDLWTAPTEAFREEIERLYEPPTRGRVIANAVEAEIALPSKKEPFVLAAGRLWDEAKNLAILDAIAGTSSWPIVLAGPRAINASTPERDAGSALRMLGALSRRDLVATMRRASIYVSPALYEPFGLSVLEAAHAGCALVLSDIPTFRELWDGAACFVEPRDPIALGAALSRLMEDSAARRRLQRLAAERACRFSPDSMVSAYRTAYDSLITRETGMAARLPAEALA